MNSPTALIFSVLLLVSGCELGVDQSIMVSPRYDLLGTCDRPDLARASAIITEALCGTMSVPENREQPDGRQIELNVMLLPATTAVVKPDPVFFLAGGPGQSAVDAGVFVFSRLHKVRRERDVVLVDQRGTGGSSSLACDFGAPEESLQKTTKEERRRAVEKMRRCLDEYDASPEFYTTPIAMDDLNYVRQELGYRQINLLGASYGTRAGLVYMRRHADTVRSAVLDGLVPLTMSIPANVAVDANSAFEKLLADCHSQQACKTAFPDLAAHFDALMLRLEADPVETQVTHSRTGESLDAVLDASGISGILRNVLYDRVLSTLVPLAIEEAYKGNYQPLVSMGMVFIPEEPVINIGMMASVLCAEDMRHANTSNPSGHFQNQIYDLLQPVCKFWPQGEIPQNYFEPVTSDAPTLLLSGALDPITPPQYAWEASKTLSNAEHIVVSGVGHGVTMQGCVPELIADFFNEPKPAGVNASCTANLSRKEFFTSYAGPVSKADQLAAKQGETDD